MQGSVAIPDTELSVVVIHLGRGHSQMVNDRLYAGRTMAYSQENVFLNPGEKAELQRVSFLIFTILKLNSVLNIEEYLNELSDNMNKALISLRFS